MNLDDMLGALISESQQAKAYAKQAKISAKASKPAPSSNAAAAALILEHKWTAVSLTFVKLTQVCSCGAEHHSSQGLFVRQYNRAHAWRTVRTPWDHEQYKSLPRTIEEVIESIDTCHECFAIDQILAIFSEPISHRQQELPL